jgi:hypothetical protein
VGIPAGLLWLRSRGLPGTAFAAGLAGLAIALVAIGYPLQRDYLEARFANRVVPEERIPGMDLDGAYAWAHDLEGARIGLAGTTAGFLGYGFYGTELDNEVVYLGEEGPHGSFDAIPGCDGFRAAVDAADLDYVVTSPFLNFIRTDDPVPSPEARWLRGSGGATPLLRDGDVTVWRLDGPVGKPCGPAQAPLREVPDAPVGE